MNDPAPYLFLGFLLGGATTLLGAWVVHVLILRALRAILGAGGDDDEGGGPERFVIHTPPGQWVTLSTDN